MSKVISSAVLPALLCVWLAATISSSEKVMNVYAVQAESRVDAHQNVSRVDAFEAESRYDAHQEPYERYTLDARVGEPISGFFATCVADARSINAKLASVIVDGIEYVRFVPDSAAVVKASLAFVPVPSSPVVATMLECAAAAKSAQAGTFMYRGGADCKMSLLRYDIEAATLCETSSKEAVFVRRTPTTP